MCQVEPAGPAGKLEMSHCYCPPCRRAHSAAFATYVTLATAAVQRTRGDDLLVARSDRCHRWGEVMRTLLRRSVRLIDACESVYASSTFAVDA